MDDILRIHRPGRPQALDQRQIEQVLALYRSGWGYRAITRELEKSGVVVDWNTVRRVIKAHLHQPGAQE